MKVKNMTGNSGNAIANQFIITGNGNSWFQSYGSMIAFIPDLHGISSVVPGSDERVKVQLDEKYWNYSKTTSKYRNQFLNETTKLQLLRLSFLSTQHIYLQKNLTEAHGLESLLNYVGYCGLQLPINGKFFQSNLLPS